MSDSIRDRILDATVEQLRRHGPAKTGVVDVARALDMSHSNVYKHFASKSALFDAVAERWLAHVMAMGRVSMRSGSWNVMRSLRSSRVVVQARQGPCPCCVPQYGS